ncbi:translocation/assembly module TamB domain-containing protein [Segnochrobactrum spirostomi]|uniref:Translocation and assembly module TamB C-terminal domain-containing protein n=1 Tax=Segnochrobactrum spirostomi TaxID=2608987 RepID=A0A6A7Y246_9HYPH|nr:translocation/assembly module TamB domain-containing protein [Segnochrobactrum spirostomi]MQT12796.1 hypothetical protein [Segnochrobactrum spirostomi]
MSDVRPARARTPRRRRPAMGWRIVRGLALGIVGLVAAVAVAVPLLLFTATGRSVLVGLVEIATRAAGMPVTIARVGGSGLDDLELGGIKVADRDGVWLGIDRVRLVWHPRALLGRVFAADTLDIGRVDVTRPPASDGTASSSSGPFTLPVGIDLKAFKVGTVALASPVAGQAVELGLAGSLGLPANDATAPVTATLSVDGRGESAPDANLAFSFVPATATLKAKLDGEEPAGGVLHRMIGVADASPLTVALAGDGTLDDWNGTLSLALGSETLTSGKARIERVTGGRRVTAGFDATIETLLPQTIKPVVAGTTRAEAIALIEDDGDIVVDKAAISGAGGSLTAKGSLSGTKRTLDFTFDAKVAGSDIYAPLVGPVATWQGATVSAKIGGTAFAPTLSLDGTIDAPTTATLTAKQAKIKANIAPAGGSLFGGDSTQHLTANVLLDGASLAGKALSAKGAPSLAVEGTLDAGGKVVIDKARLQALDIAADATGTWDRGTGTLDLTAVAADLKPLGTLIGQPLAGTLKLKASANGDPAAQTGSVDIDLTASGLATGLPEVDGLVGKTPRLSAALKAGATAVTIDRFSLESAKLQAEASGSYGEGGDGIRLKATVADLRALAPTLGGKASVDATIAGTFAAPTVKADIRSDEVIAAGERISRVKATIDGGRRTDGTLSATIALDGTARGNPVTARTSVSTGPNGDVLDIAKLDLVGLTAAGKLTRPTTGNPSGRLTVSARDIAPAAALAGIAATGGFDAAIDLGANGGNAAHVTLKSAQAAALGYDVRDVALDATVTDPLGAAAVRGTATLGGLTGDGIAADGVRVSVSGPLSALAVTAGGRLNGATLATEGTVGLPQPIGAAGPIRIALTSFSASRDAVTARLTRPGTITVNGDSVALDLALGVSGGGSATVRGTAGARQLGLDVRLEALPLALANVVKPDLGAAGTLAGRLGIAGTPAAPRIDYDLTVRGARVAAMPAAMPAVDAAVRGQTQNGRLGVTGTVTAGTTRLILDGSAPLDARGRFDLGVRGTADLALIDQIAPSPSRRVGGTLTLDGRVTGPITAPDFAGDLVLANASASDVLIGFAFQKIDGRARIENRVARIQSFAGTSRGGGTLSASGTVSLDPTQGMPANLTVTTQNLVLRYEGMVQATANSQIAITGPVLSGPLVAGKIDLGRVDVTIPNRLPNSVAPIAVEHINVPPAKLAFFPKPSPLKANGQTAPAAAPPYAANLNLAISASRHVFVSGQGIDAEFSGSFTLTGTSAAPIVNGGLTLRRGTFQLLTQQLTFNTGTIAFVDSLDPVLNLTASTQSGDVIASVNVTGRASAPQIGFSSQPSLPPDEVLSRILFNKSAGGLTIPQALMLADAVANMTGITGHGPGVLGQLKSQVGLSQLAVTTDKNDNPQVQLGGYPVKNLYVGVVQGLTAATTGVRVNVDVTKNVQLQGTVGSNGTTTLGIGTEMEY